MVRSLADHRRCEEINNTVTNGLRISSSPFQSVLSQNNGCRSSPYEYALFPVILTELGLFIGSFGGPFPLTSKVYNGEANAVIAYHSITICKT